MAQTCDAAWRERICGARALAAGRAHAVAVDQAAGRL